MTNKYIKQARELLAAECEARGWPLSAKEHRRGALDNHPSVAVLARVLEDHDKAQPTYEQRMEAMRSILNLARKEVGPETLTMAYDAHLAKIMSQPVNLLAEAVQQVWQYAEGFEHMPRLRAECLSKALDARGLQIVVKGDIRRKPPIRAGRRRF